MRQVTLVAFAALLIGACQVVQPHRTVEPLDAKPGPKTETDRDATATPKGLESSLNIPKDTGLTSLLSSSHRAAEVSSCEDEIFRISEVSAGVGAKIVRKKLQFGTLIYDESKKSNFFLIVAPAEVFNTEASGRFGFVVDCIEEGGYYNILVDSDSVPSK